MSHIRPIGPFADYRDSDIFFPVTKREIAGKSNAGFDLPLDGYRGVYRADADGNPVGLGVVGVDYTPLPMDQLTNVVEQALTKSVPTEALEGVQVRDKEGRGGAFVSREYRLPISREIEYGGRYGDRSIKNTEGLTTGTTVAFLARVTNTYDGSGSIRIYTGSEDLVCLNGLVAATDVDAYTRRHTKNVMLAMPKFAEVIASGVAKFAADVETWQRWAQTAISAEAAKAAVLELPGMSERRAKRIQERVEQEFVDRGQNVFAFVSALTYFSSHNSDEFAVRNTGNDNEAETLIRRQDQVNRWIGSQAFQQLAQAA